MNRRIRCALLAGASMLLCGVTFEGALALGSAPEGAAYCAGAFATIEQYPAYVLGPYSIQQARDLLSQEMAAKIEPLLNFALAAGAEAGLTSEPLTAAYQTGAAAEMAFLRSRSSDGSTATYLLRQRCDDFVVALGDGGPEAVDAAYLALRDLAATWQH